VGLIYAEYVGIAACRVLEAIGRLWQAVLLLRLPFHVCDACPVVGTSDGCAPRPPLARRGRRRLGCPTRPVVLLSFGGFEIRGIDFGRVERLDEFQFLTTQPLPYPVGNVRMAALDGLRYEDLVAQADVVITKPGYGIVSECLANRVPVLYTARGDFAEYDRLVEGLQRFGVCGFIGNDDLLAGN
jgi:L-arabinokinase